MKSLCFLLLFGLFSLRLAPEETQVDELIQEMSQRPREAFLIARGAAGELADRPELVKRLFQEAARQQAAKLILLEEAQVVELADYYWQTVKDQEAAARVQRGWLKVRRESLGPGKSTERLQLARLSWQWLKDRALAAELCQEALQADPNLVAAGRMLREDLAYQLTARGWQPREKVGDIQPDGNTVRPGMTLAEVRRLRGNPPRIARQHLNRRYLEQWFYDLPTPIWIEFSCIRGQEPRVLRVHPPPLAPPVNFLQPE